MRKKCCFLILAMCMVMTACGGQYKEVEVETPAVTTEAESTVQETTSAAASEVESESSQPEPTASETEESTEAQAVTADEPGYYGKYQVTSCLGTAATYAMSEEEINEKLGKTLSYSGAEVVYGEAVIAVSEYGYEEESYPVDRLYSDFRIQAADLGITSTEITAVSVLTEGNFFGNYFFVVDSDNLIVYYEGVFFEAKRV